jgi:(p)ppGpp synthase/HD superfamily hydrolase
MEPERMMWLKAERGSLEHAIQFAVMAHAGQVDKIGRAYVLHPLRVMVGVSVHGDETMAAAVLHDVIEDTPWTADELLREGFSASVVEAVQLLSRPSQGAPNRPTYKEFIRRIKDSGNTIAFAVKVQDIFDNLGRLHELPPEEQTIARRYQDALTILRGEEDLAQGQESER